MSNQQNLKPWAEGESGNPDGRPKGSRNVKSVIKELLSDTRLYSKLPTKAHYDSSQTPLEAILTTLIAKAINGDMRAADLLFKHSMVKSDYEFKPVEDQQYPVSLVRFIPSDDKLFERNQLLEQRLLDAGLPID